MAQLGFCFTAFSYLANDIFKPIKIEAKIFLGLSTGMIDAKAYVLVPESEDDNAPVTKTQVICITTVISLRARITHLVTWLF